MTDAQTKRETARKPASKPASKPPAGAKKPADRKPPAATAKGHALGEAVEVELRGQTFTVEREALNDFELIEDLAAVDGRDLSRLPPLLVRLLGREQYETAKEAMRDPDTGRVTIDAATSFFRDIFAELNPSS